MIRGMKFLLSALVLAVMLVSPAYADDNTLIELNISNIDDASILYIQRGLEKAQKTNAQGLIINIDNVKADKQLLTISEYNVEKLQKLTKTLYNSNIPVIIKANSSVIHTKLLSLYLSADIALADNTSRFGDTQNIKYDSDKVMDSYDKLYEAISAATGKNPQVIQLLSHNTRQIDAAEGVKYNIVSSIPTEKDTIKQLLQYNDKELYLKNKNILHISESTKVLKLEKDWLDSLQSVFDPGSSTMVWIDLLLWIVIIGAIIIYAPFLIPIMGYIIPIIAVIISGIIFLGMPQAHDIVYVILGVVIGLALIALDLMFVGSILLSVVGVAIIIFVLLPSFGFNINLFGGSSIMNNAIITGITILIAIIGIAGLLIYLAIKAQTKPKYSGNITMVGRVGRIIDIDEANGRYKIQIEDEIWDGVSDNVLFANDKVEVVEVDGLVLKVKRI